MKIAAYEAYMENLATQYLPIRHSATTKRFTRYNVVEVFTELRSSLDLSHFCLMLESFEGQLQDNASSALFDQQTGAFMVLRKVELDNYPAEAETLDLAKAMGLELIYKINQDSRKPGNAIRAFELSSVKYFKVGPVFDNAYGFRFEFSFYDQLSPVLNPANWATV